MIIFATAILNHTTPSSLTERKTTAPTSIIPFTYSHEPDSVVKCPTFSFKKTTLSGYFQDTSPVLPSLNNSINSDYPIPFVVMTSRRFKYLKRAIESLRQATLMSSRIQRSKRTCIFIVDRTKYSIGTTDENVQIDHVIHQASTFCNAITKVRYTVNNTKEKDIGVDKHLKLHWIWSMVQVFNHLLPNKYNGDVLFLEDDVLVSPDIFNVVLWSSLYRQSGHSIVVDGRKKKYLPIVTALSGWNGEHLYQPYPFHFRTIKGRAFPTLGYAFNRSLFKQINEIKEMIIGLTDNDWTTAVSISLQSNAMRKYKEISSYETSNDTID
jgi:hypothetical protein